MVEEERVIAELPVSNLMLSATSVIISDIATGGIHKGKEEGEESIWVRMMMRAREMKEEVMERPREWEKQKGDSNE